MLADGSSTTSIAAELKDEIEVARSEGRDACSSFQLLRCSGAVEHSLNTLRPLHRASSSFPSSRHDPWLSCEVCVPSEGAAKCTSSFQGCSTTTGSASQMPWLAAILGSQGFKVSGGGDDW